MAPWGRTGGTISGTGSGRSRPTHAARSSTPSHSTSTSSSHPSDPPPVTEIEKRCTVRLLTKWFWRCHAHAVVSPTFYCTSWALNLVELSLTIDGMERWLGIFGCKLGWVAGQINKLKMPNFCLTNRSAACMLVPSWRSVLLHLQFVTVVWTLKAEYTYTQLQKPCWSKKNHAGVMVSCHLQS